ncbi:MAG: ATP-binding protein [Ignavibacteriales bacterium]|nr:Serine-protein kinase RsbW [Ignavibacteriaceae bacterium]MCK6615447.1 ATP-binding protein [Ignavibacteriaceae bacterium]QOJ29869.1 MAG: ATP-binding protein [Ignavibacteriales bacterium]
MKQHSFELKVSSTTGELAAIREFIQEKAAQAGVSQKTIDSIILAVDEASTNIVKHAYHFDDSKEIKLHLSFEDGNCTVSLTDYGESFDPDKVPNPDMNEYLKQRRVGGLGLMLIRTLMDFVEYHTVKGKYNRLTMVKRYG